MSACPSVCVEQFGSHWMDFHEVDIRGLLKNLGTLRGGLCKFVMSGQLLLTMRNVSDRNCSEDQNMLLIFNNFFQKLCHLRDDVQKCGIARHASVVQRKVVICIPDN
jgi:hypothetical protein